MCTEGELKDTVKVEIFAHFAAKWSGAKIKPREYYVKICVCVCKLVVRDAAESKVSSGSTYRGIQLLPFQFERLYFLTHFCLKMFYGALLHVSTVETEIKF